MCEEEKNFKSLEYNSYNLLLVRLDFVMVFPKTEEER